MNANEKATDLLQSHYTIITLYGEELSEECLVSFIAIKQAIITCEAIINALPATEYSEIKYFKEVLVELEKM
jgi:hypothetical protein